MSASRVWIILLVFALTGTTVYLIAKPTLRWCFAPQAVPLWAKVIYYIVILPIYNALLLAYGALLGQFQFFWEFEKRLFKRLAGRK